MAMNWKTTSQMCIVVLLLHVTLACAYSARRNVESPARQAWKPPTIDDCLTPEEGVFSPLLNWDVIEQDRRSLRQGMEYETLLQVVIVRASGAERLVLREGPGSSFMLAVIDTASPQSEAVSQSRVRSVQIDKALAMEIQTLWIVTLGQARYPSVADEAVARLDGIKYHFWGKTQNTGARAGFAHSPQEGSYLAALCELVDWMLAYVREDREDREDLEVLRSKVHQLAQRKGNEACR